MYQFSRSSRASLNRFFSRVVIGTIVSAFILYFFFFLFYPLINVLGEAFFTEKGFTLDYVKLLLEDSSLITSFANSFKIASITTLVSLIIALPLAIIYTKCLYKGRELLSTLLITSIMVPPFVGTVGLKYLFAQYGTINTLLLKWNLIQEPIIFFASDSISLVICLQVLRLFPIMYFSLKSTLLNIDPSLDEVGVTLGVSRFKRYKDFMLPLARPGLLAGSILVFIRSLTDLGIPLITNFKEVLPMVVYEQIQDLDSKYGYVVLLTMTVITLLLSLCFQIFLKVDERHKSISKTYSKRNFARPSLSGKVGIYLFHFVLIGLTFLPHVMVGLLSLKTKWMNTLLPDQFGLDAYYFLVHGNTFGNLLNSVKYALGATSIIMVMGICASYIIANYKNGLGRILDSLTMLPLLLPGVVLAFSYFATYLNSSIGPKKLPGFLLIMSYSIRYLPFVVRSGIAGFEQMSKSLEEASIVFGGSRLQTLFKVSIPIVIPSITASVFLVFSKSIFEVSASLMLSAKKAYHPVSKIMFELCSSFGGGDSKAAALGVTALSVIVIATVISNRLQRKKRDQIYKFDE